MEITVNKDKKLIEIKKEFQKRFPYLKLEFYSEQHGLEEGSPKGKTMNEALTIGQVQSKEASGSFALTGLTTVANLEDAFAQCFGLSVQVFRKSGKLWIQTSKTDHWTLAEQNQKAMEIHEETKEAPIDAMDRMELE
jgi:hypothetical protein